MLAFLSAFRKPHGERSAPRASTYSPVFTVCCEVEPIKNHAGAKGRKGPPGAVAAGFALFSALLLLALAPPCPGKAAVTMNTGDSVLHLDRNGTLTGPEDDSRMHTPPRQTNGTQELEPLPYGIVPEVHVPWYLPQPHPRPPMGTYPGQRPGLNPPPPPPPSMQPAPPSWQGSGGRPPGPPPGVYPGIQPGGQPGQRPPYAVQPGQPPSSAAPGYPGWKPTPPPPPPRHIAPAPYTRFPRTSPGPHPAPPGGVPGRP